MLNGISSICASGLRSDRAFVGRMCPAVKATQSSHGDRRILRLLGCDYILDRHAVHQPLDRLAMESLVIERFRSPNTSGPRFLGLAEC